MKYLSTSKRSMIVKWLFAVHFICLTICAVLLFSLKRSEHLRWGLGYMIVWVTILSSLVLFFLINKQFKHWLLLKIYCAVFFVAYKDWEWIPFFFPLNIALMEII